MRYDKVDKKELINYIAVFIGLCFTLIACNHRGGVLVSGRIENGDSIVAIWVKDSIYTFPLDENDFFSGRIDLKKEGYASLMPNSVDLYLSPGEDIEIYTNARNMQEALVCKGPLGGINTYLKEQEMMTFVNKDDYFLEEKDFVRKMSNIIEERTQLLVAKNFNKKFTELEKQRIRFSVGEKAIFYPLYHRQFTADSGYRVGKALQDFLISFPLSAEELLVTKTYRKFLLNYVYFQNRYDVRTDRNYSDEIVDYILDHFQDKEVRDFLLSEVIYRYVWENNGVKGAGYMLDVFRRECSDKDKLASMNGMVERWNRLQTGMPAPDFSLEDREGNKITLSDYRGYYLYITVWASWCSPCKKELPHLSNLENRYAGKDISFLTVSIDGKKDRNTWKKLLEKNRYGGFHTLSDENNAFRSDYMIVSIPRFILIDPEGRILDSNAPRPSGNTLTTDLDRLFEKD